MSYLVVKTAANATPESYQLTNNIAAPRMAISGSYIPITTDSGNGLKVDDGFSTYRLLKTTTVSSTRSASATFLTSGVNSVGMSNTTALTRASTSSTAYGTKAGSISYYTFTLSTVSTTQNYSTSYTYSTWVFAATATYIRLDTRRQMHTYTFNGTDYITYSLLTTDSVWRKSTLLSNVTTIVRTVSFKVGGAYGGFQLVSSSVAAQTTATSYLTRSSISGYTGVSSSSSSESESATSWI